MSTATDEVEEMESSTITPEDPTTPAVETAAESEDTSTSAPDSAEAEDNSAEESTADSDGSSDASEESLSPLDRAIAHLSGKDKRAKAKEEKATEEKEAAPEKPADKAKEPEKTEPKTPVKDLSPEELAALKPKTRERIEKLSGENKTLSSEVEKIRAEYEAVKPIVEQGQAFGSVVEAYGLAPDLSLCQDADIAGAVKFQASLHRLSNGQGTQKDMELARTVFEQLDQDREHLGLSKAPAVDVSALEKAMEKAEENLDFSDLRTALAALKAPKAEPRQAPTMPVQQPIQQAPMQQPQQQPQAEPVSDVEDRMYEARAIKALVADGQKDPGAYFQKTLEPHIFAELRQNFPKENPAVLFSRLSPKARHDLTLEAHSHFQKQAQATRPKDAKLAPQSRPLAAGGTKAAWAASPKSATSSSAAISFLSGQE